MKPEKSGKNVKANNEKTSKKKGNSTLIIAVAAILVLAGVAYAFLSGNSANQKTSTTESEMKLPSYAYTNAMTLKAYKYATEHPDILEQIPCYCGCGGHSGHRFLRDCYLHDDRTYDEHASFCDVCVGEAIKVQEYLASGKTLKEARALIDDEYSKKGGERTNTPPVRDDYVPILSPKVAGISTATPEKSDLSAYSLSANFRSLADGLKLTPAGANRAYFGNLNMLIGTELETEYVTGMSQPDSFYGKKLMGMYAADFSYNPPSWIELHDLGYDNTNDATLNARNEPGMLNIVNRRPLIYGHTQNVNSVLKLMNDPNSMTTSYQTYRPLLEAVDDQNAGFALVITEPNSFSDMNYWSLTPVNGKVELVKAYNITDNKSIPAALNKYNPQTKGNVLVIKVTGDLATVNTEKDNIDQVAK